ncbi:glycoside hydrolase family 97 catalytic domain-containing protein [Galbibacter sp. EGI 63066]|uniref:glycoside hydrolase family 97 protein n=1 Tax=Galbibacter sp. EGI 63066 TaxID=2993559 RepID=UPI0022488A3B|nr:glycoside hydrolase family 97 protein [Galbibacter sp. EGI 63066]MCX2680476.1 glycoside hydrolase family 97 catalytic domain-containing protein [Galbibacter sp. EGI 63066]
MKKSLYLLIGLLILSCSHKKSEYLSSPDNSLSVEVNTKENHLYYRVFKHDSLVLDTSSLGILQENADFYNGLKILNIATEEYTDSYTMLQGKQKKIDYHANQYTIALENENNQKMNVVFNLSNDGIAFKYVFPESSSKLKKIVDEKTTFNFTANTKSWLQPMSKAKTGWQSTNPSYEEHYQMGVPVNITSEIGEGWVFPALFKAENTWVLVSETGLKNNYCASHLKYNEEAQSLKITFPQSEEALPNGALNPESTTPWETPWRILAIGDLKTITESTLGTDLAEKAIDMDTSFIKGGFSSWSWVLLKDDFTNYETSKKFIEYAADMNWPYCLIDADWDRKIGYDRMKELVDYAKTKDVKVLVWYNSAGSWNTTPYTPRDKLVTAENRVSEFKKLNEIGVSGVKIDFFGGDGQSVIAYYHDILQDATKHKLLVNFHGATLPRGWQRTYPNLLTVEAIKGEEFITFEQENADKQASHSALLPFTRNVFDPMDFTPMVLDSIPNITRKTTPAFELALPILFLSGIQHIAEIPEGMNKQPDYVVDYLKDIPVNWDESRFITGYPGKDVVMARRFNDIWFVIGINGENKKKEITIDLSFLKNKKGFFITDSGAGFSKQDIESDSITSITLQPHGGFVMKF